MQNIIEIGWCCLSLLFDPEASIRARLRITHKGGPQPA